MKKNPQTKDNASYLSNANVFYCWKKIILSDSDISHFGFIFANTADKKRKQCQGFELGKFAQKFGKRTEIK